MGFFDWVGTALGKTAAAIAKGIRRFVVYTLIVFFFGMVAGSLIAQKSMPDAALYFFAPLGLAFLAYLYTEIAAVLFVIVLLIFLGLFIL